MMVQTTLTFFSPNFSLELFQNLERGRQPPLLVICIDNHCSQVWLCLFSFYPRLPPPPQVQANMVVNKQAMGGYDECSGWKWSRVLSHASSQPPPLLPFLFLSPSCIFKELRGHGGANEPWPQADAPHISCSPHFTLLFPPPNQLFSYMTTLHLFLIGDSWWLYLILLLSPVQLLCSRYRINQTGWRNQAREQLKC